MCQEDTESRDSQKRRWHRCSSHRKFLWINYIIIMIFIYRWHIFGLDDFFLRNFMQSDYNWLSYSEEDIKIKEIRSSSLRNMWMKYPVITVKKILTAERAVNVMNAGSRLKSKFEKSFAAIKLWAFLKLYPMMIRD